MGDDQGRAVVGQPGRRLMNQQIGFVIYRRGCLIKKQYRRIPEDRSGDRNALPLSSAELHATLAYLGLIAIFQGNNKVVCICALRCTLDFCVRGVGPAEPDIFENGR